MEKTLVPAQGVALQPSGVERKLKIVVAFTSVAGTEAALKAAGGLAADLNARIELVVPQVVPYPLPLESPPVLIEFQERRFREFASHCPVETRVQVYLCRDPGETLLNALQPGSLVVLGGRRRWWPTRESALARKLKRAGHEVIFKEQE